MPQFYSSNQLLQHRQEEEVWGEEEEEAVVFPTCQHGWWKNNEKKEKGLEMPILELNREAFFSSRRQFKKALNGTSRLTNWL